MSDCVMENVCYFMSVDIASIMVQCKIQKLFIYTNYLSNVKRSSFFVTNLVIHIFSSQ